MNITQLLTLDLEKLMFTNKIKLILIFLATFIIPSKTAFCAETIQNYHERESLVGAVEQGKKFVKLQHGNKRDREIRTILKIAQGYIKLGQFPLAIVELEKVQLSTVSDSQTKALIQLRLGNAYRGNGQLSKAVTTYKNSLKEEKFLSTFNNLARTYQDLKQATLIKAREIKNPADTRQYYSIAKKYEQQAWKYVNRALSVGNSESLEYLYSLSEWSKFKGNRLSFEQLAKAQRLLTKVTPTRSSVYLLINWAAVDSQRTVYWLGKAEKISQQLGDPQLQSYVYLELANFYFKNQNLVSALKYAKQVQESATPELASESLYRSQKLLGDIYQLMGRRSLAIDSYRSSISSIDILNRSISKVNSDFVRQFNLAIQPVYRSTLKAILEQPTVSPRELNEALIISNKLRLSELVSYFGENCFEVDRQQLKSKLNPHVAIINSIVLQDKVFFILQLPNGKIVKNDGLISEHRLNKLATQWRKELQAGFAWEFRDRSQFFYDLIVRPFERELESVRVKKIIFIQDGILRNLPMAALLDEDRFLVEKWAISSSIGFKLKSSPTPKINPRALVFGLSNPDRFQPQWVTISGVLTEISQIKRFVEAREFLNSKFTLENLKTELKEDDYSILHLATHGFFGGTADTSYVLAYDRKISMVELENALEVGKQAPDLLVLSACETALSSKLSVLGIAGVATKSGVENTIGSLWQVQDENQTEIIERFYTNLNQDLSNVAEALQKTQIEQIHKFAHPQKWAALNLISSY